MIADSGSGLRLCEVHQPAPKLIGSFVRPGYVTSLAVSSDVVYATTNNSTLSTIDIHDLAHMRQTGIFDKGSGDIALWGRYAYLLGGGRFTILDLLDPSEPAEVMAIGVGGMAQNFTVEPLNQSLYAVVSAEGPESLRAIDVAIPTKPRLVASVPDFGFSLAAHGNSIYVGQKSLTIYDFADPTTLRSVGYLSLPNRITEIAARGRYAYLADEGYGLRIVDASAPTQPEEVGSLNLPCSTYLALDELRAVVAGCTGLDDRRRSRSGSPCRTRFLRRSQHRNSYTMSQQAETTPIWAPSTREWWRCASCETVFRARSALPGEP